MNELDPIYIDRVVKMALDEDIGSGDITTLVDRARGPPWQSHHHREAAGDHRRASNSPGTRSTAWTASANIPCLSMTAALQRRAI